MYKVFINKFSIILTSKNKYLHEENTYLLASINFDEILKKVRKQKKIFLYHPKKSDLLKVFKSKIKVVFASGGIVSNENCQILFIYRRGKWDLPKGKAEKGETIRETAIREVMEETGIQNLKIEKYFSNTFHIVRNKGKNDISKLCLLMKVNKKKYELCYGQTKDLIIKKNGQKTFLINLTELMNISTDAERPYVKILSKI